MNVEVNQPPSNMQSAAGFRPVLIGTAGHIDHGKTQLVARLSGTNTDRLPEERRRGISIDLGFAHLDHRGFRFGIVDVPGHERFVRQMVAGATSLDAALLVVAADDGVMPQTREHFDILRLLGIERGVVAITKCDLVDDEMQQLVGDEIQTLTAGSFLDSAPVVCVSSKTGEGIDQLKDALADVAEQISDAPSTLPFRMPIDRIFSLPGRGTVVTGSVMSGNIAAGSDVELLPAGRILRVRSVQHHGESVAQAGCRRRAAINLPGIDVDEIHRGCELVEPRSLMTSHRLLTELTCLQTGPAKLTHRKLLDLHIGTQVTPARLRLDGDGILAGATGFAELRTRLPVVAQWGQRFIVRSSAGITVGGGRIIDPLPGKFRIRERPRRLKGASSSDAIERIQSVLRVQPSIGQQESLQRLGLTDDELQHELASSALKEQIVTDATTGRFVHRDWLTRLGRAVVRVLKAELTKRQPARMLPESVLLSACSDFRGNEFVPLAIQQLIEQEIVVRRGSLIGPVDMQVQLTRRQQKWLDAVVEAVIAGNRTPPTHKELLKLTGIPGSKELDSLLALAHEDGLLVGVSPELTYSSGSLDDLKSELRELFGRQRGVTLAEIRDAFGMTRKHVVPLAEYFDETGVTIRQGDLRHAGPALSTG